MVKMKVGEKPQIVICGSIAIDRIMNFSGQYKDLVKPDKIDVLSISVFLDKLIDSYGGVGANICHTLALLGENPILLGSVGPDADRYLQKLAEHGVNVEHVHRSHIPTASFNVITDGDSNQVGGFFPGAMFDSEKLSFQKWKDENIFVTVAPHCPTAMRRQVAECKVLGLRMFYDIGQQVSNIPEEDIAMGVEAAELLIVNDYEFAVICEKTGKSAEEVKEKVPVVVITRGKDGSTIEGKDVDGILRIPAAKPETVADPTGAGDAFRAGFLYGYVRGWDLETCGKMGATTAVYAVERHGTQEHLFDREEFDKRYRENFEEEIAVLN